MKLVQRSMCRADECVTLDRSFQPGAQLGGLIALPFAGIYVAGEIGAVLLDTNNLLVILAVLLAIDAIHFYVSTATYRGEEILSKWR